MAGKHGRPSSHRLPFVTSQRARHLGSVGGSALVVTMSFSFAAARLREADERRSGNKTCSLTRRLTACQPGKTRRSGGRQEVSASSGREFPLDRNVQTSIHLKNRLLRRQKWRFMAELQQERRGRDTNEARVARPAISY